MLTSVAWLAAGLGVALVVGFAVAPILNQALTQVGYPPGVSRLKGA